MTIERGTTWLPAEGSRPTAHELRCLAHLMLLGAKEAAGALGVHPQTVKRNAAAVYTRLGVAGDARSAARAAQRLGWLRIPALFSPPGVPLARAARNGVVTGPGGEKRAV